MLAWFDAATLLLILFRLVMLVQRIMYIRCGGDT